MALLHSFRNIAIRLEAWLDGLGTARSSAIMSVVAVGAVLGVHALLRTVEGEPLLAGNALNVVLQTAAVAVPLIVYSRRGRAKLTVVSRGAAAAAAEAHEASRAKSAFLANMSHELRTPLNAILGFSEIMKDQHLGALTHPRYLAYAADIHTSGRHLLGIINDILDLAKIESGKMSLEDAGEFKLVPALSASLVILTGLGEKHGVMVRGAWEDENVRLVAVERMVRQIVINLVGNAIKFTPAGGSVTLGGAPDAGGGYVLTVRDDGIGMNEAEIANALTPFGQNRTKLTVRQEGTGLGLPLAKAMIELHGGHLLVESQPNRGTCISLRFPPERVAYGRAQEAA